MTDEAKAALPASGGAALAQADPAAPHWAGLAMFGVFARDKTAMIGLIFIAALVLMAVFAPLIAPFPPTQQSIVNSFKPPSEVFWLGTDAFGRDVFSRIIWGARSALLVGVLAVLVSMVIGIPIGMLAGFRMAWLDRVVGAIVDVMLSFPSLLLALMIVTLLGSGLHTVIIAIGFAHVPIFIRLARSSTLVVRNLDFIGASRSFGAPDLYILMRHVLPNIIGPIIIMGTLSIAGAIRDEASLSFLGLGIQPPAPSWGNIIRDGIANILEAPWMAIAPGIFLTITVLAFNMIGDSLRDMLDPRDIASWSTNRKKP